MREIIPGKLWLGNAADAGDLRRLLNLGVGAIVDLAFEEQSPTLTRSIVYCRIPIVDGEQESRKILRIAIETLVSLLKQEIPTFVYCRAGMSRSPAVLAAALSVVAGGSPEERLRQIVADHPHDVSPILWRDVTAVCAEMREIG